MDIVDGMAFGLREFCVGYLSVGSVDTDTLKSRHALGTQAALFMPLGIDRILVGAHRLDLRCNPLLVLPIIERIHAHRLDLRSTPRDNRKARVRIGSHTTSVPHHKRPAARIPAIGAARTVPMAAKPASIVMKTFMLDGNLEREVKVVVRVDVEITRG